MVCTVIEELSDLMSIEYSPYGSFEMTLTTISTLKPFEVGVHCIYPPGGIDAHI